MSSPLVFSFVKQISELAIAKRLPLICLFAEFPKAGGLTAYGPNVSKILRRSGDYVAKILHGAKPSELPIQRPERFDLVINLKTATALGLDVPTQLQQLADEVIEEDVSRFGVGRRPAATDYADAMFNLARCCSEKINTRRPQTTGDITLAAIPNRNGPCGRADH